MAFCFFDVSMETPGNCGDDQNVSLSVGTQPPRKPRGFLLYAPRCRKPIETQTKIYQSTKRLKCTFDVSSKDTMNANLMST